MTSISKNVYIDKLDDNVNKYNNTYHKTIKMKPVDAKPSTYIDSRKDPKFKIGDIVRISNYKNIFAKGYVPNWSEVFVIKKLKKTVPWTFVISDLKGNVQFIFLCNRQKSSVNVRLMKILKSTATNPANICRFS